jgi:hypothetical protein
MTTHRLQALRTCMRRTLATLGALLAVACGGGSYIGDPLLALGKSFRIGANPAEITVAAGGTAAATLELTCIFNSRSIDVSLTNADELARAQLVLAPRRADRGCGRATGTRNGAGQAIYAGTVDWPITVLDDAPPGRYTLQFFAEARGEGIANTEVAALVVIVTAPAPGGFALSMPADVLVSQVEPPAQRQADVPIAVTRAGATGAIALATSAIGADGAALAAERIAVSSPPSIPSGATSANAIASYAPGATAPIPAPGERVLVTASAGGVSRSLAVRLRGDSLAPPEPARLTAAARTDRVTLSWDFDRAASSYRLERAPGEDGPFALLATLAALSSTYTDTTVQPQARYVYRLHAINPHGTSAPAQVSATTFGLPVLSVTVRGSGSVRSEPAGIDCGSACIQPFADGTVVRLIKLPAAGFGAGDFGGDPDCRDSVVTMSRSIECTIDFVPQSGSGWQLLGGALAAGSAAPPAFSLALDDDRLGAPVVAYVEADPNNAVGRLFVKRLNAAAWETLGAGALNAGSATAASDPALATRAGSPIHVAWSQGNGVQQNVFVARFDGNAWQSVGAPGVPLNVVAGSHAVRPSLALDPATGAPHVAWIEDGAVKWKRFDGTDWVGSVFGGEGPASAAADRVQLASQSASPLIAWTEGPVNDRKLKVTAGQSFTPFARQVNAPFDVPVTITHFGLRQDGIGAIVLWTQDERPFSTFARRWQDGPWEDHGAPPVDGNSNQLLSFAVAQRSVDVAFSLQPPASAAFVSVFHRSGGQWVALPSLATPGTTLRQLALELRRNDEPFVAGIARDAAGAHELRVYRHFP